MMKKSFLFLADGFEEIEAIATADVLRRGEVDLTTLSIHPGRLAVTGAHGVTITADATFEAVAGEDPCFLIFPGGMPGAENLGNHPALVDRAQCHLDRGGMIAAICAAPAMVLSKLRFPRPFSLTCYPGYESFLSRHRVLLDGLVVDENLITARGPAFAARFALEIVARIHDRDRADAVAAGMLL